MTSPSLLILGTDAVLAAAPATPVQLTHACIAAGYRAVVPASWGDELVARATLDALKNTNGPVVQCCCPHASRRLSPQADGIGSMLLTGIAPPVAAALYLRALYAPATVRVSYAGACPAAAHPSIDAWLSPAELLADLDRKTIRLAEQPTEFDSVLPPDRRRHYSEPGGLPAEAALRALRIDAEISEVAPQDFAIDLAQQLLAQNRRLVDVAPALGCACSGAVANGAAGQTRSRVHALEPPRAPTPVVDHSLDLGIDLVQPVPVQPGIAMLTPIAGGTGAGNEAVPVYVPSSPTNAATTEVAPGPVGTGVTDLVRRRSPSGTRVVLGAMPQFRSAGKQLPRAYVARRRSSPKGIRQSGVRRQIEDVEAAVHRRVPRWLWVGGAGAFLLVVSALLLRLL